MDIALLKMPGQADLHALLDLARHGEAVALVTDGGEPVSYTALAALADAFAARLGSERRLVALKVRNDVASIAAYLGALRGGHVVLLLGTEPGTERIFEAFAPDAWFDALTGELALAPAATGGLHPELALLLSTSGSTGSPKLVRLSGTAVAANAASIIQYLEIGPDARALTTLPFHYSYGLSVLNSHLMAGASLALTELSVVHPDFPAFLACSGSTSIPGVPYTWELFERAELLAKLPPTVRTLTQAGGRMPPERVRALAALGHERGFRLFVMYGQTEATARMAFLPPDLANAHPDCIGGPIPGGRFELRASDDSAVDAVGVTGELVYQGPNVMMGYALARADLARGAELAELRTGDLAERTPEGLLRIVGRASRFAKIAGLRVGFDDVEALLARAGAAAVVAGNDRLLVARVAAGTSPAERARLQELVSTEARIPAAMVVVSAGEVPRLASGKPDLKALLTAGEAEARARDAARGQGVHPIKAGFLRAFNRSDLADDASFQSLGGDSLAYVNVTIALEKVLGALPPRWEEMPISALAALTPESPKARRGMTLLGTDVIIRLWALLLVMLGHAAPDQTVALRGGAVVLMLLAGYNFARFQRTAFERGEPWPVVRGTLERLILPYMLVMLPMLLLSSAQRSWGWFALVSVFTVEERGPLFAFWFIETVFHALLLMVLFYQIPALRRLSAARPFHAGLLLLAVAVAAKYLVPRFLFDDFNPISLTVDAHFYLYVLGFLALVARGAAERLVLVGLAAGLIGLDFGWLQSRQLWAVAALCALLFVPACPVPGVAAGPLLRAAAASYFIYVVHVPMHHVTHFMLKLSDWPAASIAVSVGGSIAGGILFEYVWSRMVSRARKGIGRGHAG